MSWGFAQIGNKDCKNPADKSLPEMGHFSVTHIPFINNRLQLCEEEG